MYQKTSATAKIQKLKKRIRAVVGGTSASKTISILLWLIHLAQSDEKPTLTSIVSESFPHLKRGVMRDFISILQAHNYFKDDLWNKTDYTYTFETGSKIEFFSVDQPGKVRGPRRDRLFMNEANNIPYETFDQLEVRTKDFIFLDWNPISSFWYYDEVKGKRQDSEELTLTYKDNEALDPAIVAAIEARRGNKQWWRVYGEGQLGETEGRIYTGWRIIDEIPFEARLERRCLDFGYSNDPSAIVDIYYFNGGYIFDEKLYRKGMSNKDISSVIQALDRPETLIIADSAEPKSIDELRTYGLNVQPAQKGKDSVRQGIQLLQGQAISVTKQSLNLIKEYRGYLWETDKNGKILNEPQKFQDHCLDAVRYGIGTLSRIEPPKTYFDRIWEKELAPPEERPLANKGR